MPANQYYTVLYQNYARSSEEKNPPQTKIPEQQGTYKIIFRRKTANLVFFKENIKNLMRFFLFFLTDKIH